MIAGANSTGTPITLNGQSVGGRYIDVAHGSTVAGPMWALAMRAGAGPHPRDDVHAPDRARAQRAPTCRQAPPATAQARSRWHRWQRQRRRWRDGHGGRRRRDGGARALSLRLPSSRRTAAATAPPSARPLVFGVSTPITRPMALMPSSRTPSSSMVSVTRASTSSVAELLGQVVGDHRRLGLLLGGLLVAAGVGEGLRGLATLLGLAGQHAEDVLVGELARLLAGDLGVGDRGQHHPQGRGPQSVAGLDGRW